LLIRWDGWNTIFSARRAEKIVFHPSQRMSKGPNYFQPPCRRTNTPVWPWLDGLIAESEHRSERLKLERRGSLGGNSWPTIGYMRRLFEGVGELQDIELPAMAADDLHRDRETVRRKTTRHGHRR